MVHHLPAKVGKRERVKQQTVDPALDAFLCVGSGTPLILPGSKKRSGQKLSKGRWGEREKSGRATCRTVMRMQARLKSCQWLELWRPYSYGAAE